MSACNDSIRTHSHAPSGARRPRHFTGPDRSLRRRSVVARFGRANPDASRLDGYDGAFREQRAMRVDCRDSSQALVSSADVDQAQDASMANASDDGQFAEVLVERDHGLLMFRGVREDREVSGILGPVRDGLGLVAGVGQGAGR